jgi:class 3 adenylate cyclase/predicted ATPase
VDIAEWLKGLGLSQYARAFADNDIDEHVLMDLTAEDLTSIGVASVGHRRRLLSAIATLQQPDTPLASAPALSPAAAEAERRQLTVMFCDLVGSTALASRVDQEDLHEIIAAYHRGIAETVGRFAGFVAKYMGDGVLIYFGYPRAHEDDAERAVRAGLAVVEAVGRLPAPERLQARIGIATGVAVVGDLIGEGAAQERGVVGETPNLAARLQTLAAPNTLVIAEATRRQIGGLFDLADLGAQSLAGFAKPQSAWRVIGESGILSRFEALRSGTMPLVGRGEELDLLLRRWEQAKSGEGRVVLLSGEPGIGKSRMTAAVYRRVEGEPPTRLRYFCSPHHQDSALYPIIAQLERAAGFARDDGPEAKLGKFVALFGSAAEPADISLLAELMSLPGGEAYPPLDISPQRRKERTLEALLLQLERLANQQPVLMIFEDLHWIDPTSRELLDLTVERLTRLPVLLVATFRPEFQPPWAGRPQVTVIALNRLGRRDGVAMIEQLSGTERLSSEIIAAIVERTDGVPLFVEEMTKAVLEAGAAGAGEAAASIPPPSLGVPATLHASLMARLDRLGPAAREVAQIGAAIGREFSYELAGSVGRLQEGTFQDAVRRLVDAGLVFERGVPPTAEYLFKHALVQDTAYSTLLRGPRQALHGRIGKILEERFPALVESQPEIAAHHFEAANLPDQAVAHWHSAGKLSLAKSATREAITQLRRGLGLLGDLSESAERRQLALDINITLAAALRGAKGYADPEVIAVLNRARQLIVETAGTGTPLHFTVLYGLWVTDYVSGNARAVRDQAEDFLSLAQTQSTPGALSIGHRLMGIASMMTGDCETGVTHLEAAIRLYRPEEHRDSASRYGQDMGASVFYYWTWGLWHRGHPDQAMAAIDRAVGYAREFGHAHTLVSTLFHVCMTALFARDVAAVDRYSAEVIAISAEHGFALWPGYGNLLAGWATAQKGQAATGVEQMRRGLAMAQATGSHIFESCWPALIAEGLAQLGMIDEGLGLVDKGLAKVAGTGEVWFDADVYRLRGELMRRLPNPNAPEIETWLGKAVATARAQGTRGYELRAATTLAQFLRGQGKRSEAHDLLAPIYAWFTEGFDRGDLKAARTLLDELV